MLIMLPDPWYPVTAGVASIPKDFNGGGNRVAVDVVEVVLLVVVTFL